MIERLMEEWQVAGFTYRRFDLRGGIEFLAAEFGKEFVKAFRLASHKRRPRAFSGCAFCCIGEGLYVDADDRLVGDPERLLAGRSGCLLFREPQGAISNNVIVSSPDHPVIAYAVEMALHSLLGREKDNTWSKTGPGLLTRATACAIAARPQEVRAAGLSILPQSDLAPVIGAHLVLPYQSTAAYWNWSGGRALPRAVEEVLQQIIA